MSIYNSGGIQYWTGMDCFASFMAGLAVGGLVVGIGMAQIHMNKAAAVKELQFQQDSCDKITPGSKPVTGARGETFCVRTEGQVR